jgi:catechol 2,3-dioxygenase-like lactoylglutathione lyase family enzyme
MRLVRSLCLLSVLCAPVVTMAPPRRPEIQGIALVRLRVSDMKAAQHFYHEIIGLYPLESAGAKASDDKTVYFLNKDQRLELIAGTPSGDAYAIDVVGFQVSNVKQMRKYLLARGQKCEAVQKTSSGNEYVATLDPENHPIWFVSWARRTGPLPGFIHTEHMIHAGFIVRDRSAEDHFYKDLLGFHVYWQGGRTEGETLWAAMQVPDGTDWLEYMLGIPANPDVHTRGVQDHISIGTDDIHVKDKQLIANGWKPTEEPKIGLDGKWQLNLYEPDQTRIEFMEFTPVQKPCCSPFVGPQPGPKN